jgi:hypothetical protein
MSTRAMKVRVFTFCSCLLPLVLHADTMGKYMGIARSIPNLALKADDKSQAWARSARSILAVTDETIAQTINAMNKLAAQDGQPILCMPKGTALNGKTVHELLQNKAKSLSEDEGGLTISSVAASVLKERYPCSQVPAAGMGFMAPAPKMKSVRR